MLTNETVPQLVRTSAGGTFHDPYAPKLRAFVATSRAEKGRNPTDEEMSAFGKTLGIRCSIAPNLAGRAVGAAPAAPPPVAKAAPVAPRPASPPKRRTSQDLSDAEHEDRATRFHALKRQHVDGGMHPNVASKEAFATIYGDLYAK